MSLNKNRAPDLIGAKFKLIMRCNRLTRLVKIMEDCKLSRHAEANAELNKIEKEIGETRGLIDAIDKKSKEKADGGFAL